jgi:hypothetical protein
MNHETVSGSDFPRLIIYSDGGPLAGDLGACLAGRFLVDRVTSLAAAGRALDRSAAALLVAPNSRMTLGTEFIPLVRRAVCGGCRVLLVGCDLPGTDEDLRNGIQALPQFPSPDLLFASLLDQGSSSASAAKSGRA